MMHEFFLQVLYVWHSFTVALSNQSKVGFKLRMKQWKSEEASTIKSQNELVWTGIWDSS